MARSLSKVAVKTSSMVVVTSPSALISSLVDQCAGGNDRAWIERSKSLVHAAEEIAGEFLGLTGQVGPSEPANEDGVPHEQYGLADQQRGGAGGGMSRQVHRHGADHGGAEVELVAVFEGGPVGKRDDATGVLRRQVVFGAEPGGDGGATADVVGMDVGVHDVCDGHVVNLCELQVSVGRPGGVDDDGVAAGNSDEVGQARLRGSLELPHPHVPGQSGDLDGDEKPVPASVPPARERVRTPRASNSSATSSEPFPCPQTITAPSRVAAACSSSSSITRYTGTWRVRTGRGPSTLPARKSSVLRTSRISVTVPAWISRNSSVEVMVSATCPPKVHGCRVVFHVFDTTRRGILQYAHIRM